MEKMERGIKTLSYIEIRGGSLPPAPLAESERQDKKKRNDGEKGGHTENKRLPAENVL